MSSTTISLERSAYESLKQAKLPGESFSETVRRLTEHSGASLRGLIGLFDRQDAVAMAAMIAEWRAKDYGPRPKRSAPRRRRNGRSTRQ